MGPSVAEGEEGESARGEFWMMTAVAVRRMRKDAAAMIEAWISRRVPEAQRPGPVEESRLSPSRNRFAVERESATEVNEALWCFPAVVFPGGVR